MTAGNGLGVSGSRLTPAACACLLLSFEHRPSSLQDFCIRFVPNRLSSPSRSCDAADQQMRPTLLIVRPLHVAEPRPEGQSSIHHRKGPAHDNRSSQKDSRSTRPTGKGNAASDGPSGPSGLLSSYSAPSPPCQASALELFLRTFSLNAEAQLEYASDRPDWKRARAAAPNEKSVSGYSRLIAFVPPRKTLHHCVRRGSDRSQAVQIRLPSPSSPHETLSHPTRDGNGRRQAAMVPFRLPFSLAPYRPKPRQLTLPYAVKEGCPATGRSTLRVRICRRRVLRDYPALLAAMTSMCSPPRALSPDAPFGHVVRAARSAPYPEATL